MGMFDKDKEIGRVLTSVFDYGDEFVLWNVNDGGKVDTEIGEARKTVLLVSRKSDPNEKFEVSTLSSAIADKAEKAESGDFPAVVQVLKVPSKKGNDATVLQFVKAFTL